jgi:hypothetical protein
MNTKTNTSAASDNNAEKAVQAFYLSGKTPVSLWINRVTTKGAPDFDGTIGGQRVALRIRNGANGKFIAITRSLKPSEIGENGYKEAQIGSANLVVNDRGIPNLAIKLDADKDHTIWANVGLRVPQELLVAAGLNLDILAQKKAAYQARKAEAQKQDSQEAVPA